MLTYLYVHPMPLAFYLSLLASHEPVHWTILLLLNSVQIFLTRSGQMNITQTQQQAEQLFCTKVEEECDALGLLDRNWVSSVTGTQMPTEGTGLTIPTTLGDATMAQVTYRGVKYDTNNRPSKDVKAEKATLVYRGIAVKS